MKLIFENWRRYQQEVLNEAEDLPRVKTRARMRDAAPGTPEREYQDLMRAGPTVPRPSDVAYREEADKIRRIRQYDPEGAEIKAREKGTLAQMRKAYEEEVPLTMQLLGGLLGVTDIPDAMIAYDEFTDVLARYEEDQKGDPEDTLQHATERPRGASMSNLHMEANTNKGAPTTLVEVGFAAAVLILAILAVIPLAGKGFKAFKVVLRRVAPQLADAFKYAKGWAQHQRRSSEAREAIEKAMYEISTARKQGPPRAPHPSRSAKTAAKATDKFEVVTTIMMPPSAGDDASRLVTIIDTPSGKRAFYQSSGLSVQDVKRIDRSGREHAGAGPKFLEMNGFTVTLDTSSGTTKVPDQHVTKIGKAHPDVGKHVSRDSQKPSSGKYSEPGSPTDQIGYSLEKTPLTPAYMPQIAQALGLPPEITHGRSKTLAAVNKVLSKGGYTAVTEEFLTPLMINGFLRRHGVNIADTSNKWGRGHYFIPDVTEYPGKKVPQIKDLVAAWKQVKSG